MSQLSMPVAGPWKPCDLRGVFPSEVSEIMFRRIGAAIGTELEEGGRVVVGGDFRLSTSALKAALIEGLASTGLQVLDCGQIPTPVAYFQMKEMYASGVLMVTASHNPPDHNGLKWMLGELPPSQSDINRIRSAAELGTFRGGRGSVEKVDPLPRYRDWILSRWRGLPARQYGPIVLDPGHGAWSAIAPGIFQELGFDVKCLFCEPNGRFPGRAPDCARTANLSALRAAVLEHRATLGIAWDGDGDRVAFVDETGRHATTDEISILLARHALRKVSRGEPVVCDIKLSDGVRREVLRAGGTPLLERSGHAFMRRRLLCEGALLGLDACGHYFFREAGSRDDGLYSALFLLKMLKGTSLAALRASLAPLFGTPELRLPSTILDYETVLDRLRTTFPGAKESSIDGTRMVLDNGIVLARESSTEAVVSLRVEGFTRSGYDHLVRECLSALLEGRELLLHQIEAGAM